MGVEIRLACIKSEWWGGNVDLESRNTFGMGIGKGQEGVKGTDEERQLQGAVGLRKFHFIFLNVRFEPV